MRPARAARRAPGQPTGTRSQRRGAHAGGGRTGHPQRSCAYSPSGDKAAGLDGEVGRAAGAAGVPRRTRRSWPSRRSTGSRRRLPCASGQALVRGRSDGVRRVCVAAVSGSRRSREERAPARPVDAHARVPRHARFGPPRTAWPESARHSGPALRLRTLGQAHQPPTRPRSRPTPRGPPCDHGEGRHVRFRTAGGVSAETPLTVG